MMKKVLVITVIILASLKVGAQSFYLKTHDLPIYKKVENELRYRYSLGTKDSCDYTIEVFFSGSYSFVKRGYAGYYKLYDKKGLEIYKSDEWKCGSYGGVCENYITKKVVIKDLPNALKGIKK